MKKAFLIIMIVPMQLFGQEVGKTVSMEDSTTNVEVTLVSLKKCS